MVSGAMVSGGGSGSGYGMGGWIGCGGVAGGKPGLQDMVARITREVMASSFKVFLSCPGLSILFVSLALVSESRGRQSRGEFALLVR